jgi:hypothetical protein
MICAAMTLLRGTGHALPFLIPSIRTATALATAVVIVELFAVAWTRKRYVECPFATSLI